MEEGNYHKFTKGKENPDMMRKLLATGERELIEVSFRPAARRKCLTVASANTLDRHLQRIAYGASGLARPTQKQTVTNGVRTGWVRRL